jgi:hypothetical protein
VHTFVHEGLKGGAHAFVTEDDDMPCPHVMKAVNPVTSGVVMLPELEAPCATCMTVWRRKEEGGGSP